MLDNLLTATNTTRTSLSNLKKKVSKIRTQLDDLSSDLEKVDTKFENILSQAEVYKAKLEREMGREVRRLEKELAILRSSASKFQTAEETDETDLKVAQTIGIFDTLLRHMCQNADDFRLASESFLFPAVYERLMAGADDAYFIEEVPQSAVLVIKRGKEYIDWIRSEFDTHITDPDAWSLAVELVVDWWRNDALPLLYGSRDEQWDIDIPLTLTEMLLWRESPGDRPLNFPRVFDAYEIYRKNKDQVYESTGLRQFDLRNFRFEQA